MTLLHIPGEALIFVGDGQKALVLRNAGDATRPNLVVERVFNADNPPTREQGSDRAGRNSASAGATVRSSVAATDWHMLEKQRFAKDVAGALERLVRDTKVRAIVVAAPPRTLSEIRQALSPEVRSRVVLEIDRDLTNHPVPEIQRLILAS